MKERACVLLGLRIVRTVEKQNDLESRRIIFFQPKIKHPPPPPTGNKSITFVTLSVLPIIARSGS